MIVVVSAPAVNKICESFTHNPLTQDQGNTTFIYLMQSTRDVLLI